MVCAILKKTQSSMNGMVRQWTRGFTSALQSTSEWPSSSEICSVADCIEFFLYPNLSKPHGCSALPLHEILALRHISIVLVFFQIISIADALDGPLEFILSLSARSYVNVKLRRHVASTSFLKT